MVLARDLHQNRASNQIPHRAKNKRRGVRAGHKKPSRKVWPIVSERRGFTTSFVRQGPIANVGVVLESPTICLPLLSPHPLCCCWLIPSTIVTTSSVFATVDISFTNRPKSWQPGNIFAVMVDLTFSATSTYPRLSSLRPSLHLARFVDSHALAYGLAIPVQTWYSKKWAARDGKQSARKVGSTLPPSLSSPFLFRS